MGRSPLLKVCYIVRRYPRLSETFIVNEIQELIRQSLDVIVLAKLESSEEIIHEKTKNLQVPVYYLPKVTSIPGETWTVKRLKNLTCPPDILGQEMLRGDLSQKDFDALVEASMIAPLIKRLGIDLLHAHFASWSATAAYFLSKITGIPYSFTAHAKDIYHKSVDKPFLAEKMAKARFVITVSNFNKNHLENILSIAGKTGQVNRLYNGIDLEQFKPIEIEKEPNLLVAVGRLTPKKGFNDLIEACKIIKQRGRIFRCVVIGKGKEKEALEALIKKNGLENRVTLIGVKAQKEVIQMIRKAALFVLPCIVSDDGDRDGLPTVLLEAMALGTPVVSTQVTGIPEMIQNNQSGLLVPEKEPLALAGAIERLLDSESLRKQLAKSALEKVRDDFNLTKNVTQLKNYFLSEGR